MRGDTLGSSWVLIFLFGSPDNFMLLNLKFTSLISRFRLALFAHISLLAVSRTQMRVAAARSRHRICEEDVVKRLQHVQSNQMQRKCHS